MNAVAKWGNSLALRLPRSVAAEANLTEGTPVDMRIESGNLVVAVAKPKYKLSELLAAHKVDHNHKEIDFGPSVGEEAW